MNAFRRPREPGSSLPSRPLHAGRTQGTSRKADRGREGVAQHQALGSPRHHTPRGTLSRAASIAILLLAALAACGPIPAERAAHRDNLPVKMSQADSRFQFTELIFSSKRAGRVASI